MSFEDLMNSESEPVTKETVDIITPTTVLDRTTEARGQVMSFEDLMNSESEPVTKEQREDSKDSRDGQSSEEEVYDSFEAEESMESESPNHSQDPESEEEYSMDELESESESESHDVYNHQEQPAAELHPRSPYKVPSPPKKLEPSLPPNQPHDSVAPSKPESQAFASSSSRESSPVPKPEPRPENVPETKIKIKIVRDYPRAETPQMKDVGTQFTGNDASSQADIVPIGMHGASPALAPTAPTAPTAPVQLNPVDRATYLAPPAPLPGLAPPSSPFLHHLQIIRQQMDRRRLHLDQFRRTTARSSPYQYTTLDATEKVRGCICDRTQVRTCTIILVFLS